LLCQKISLIAVASAATRGDLVALIEQVAFRGTARFYPAVASVGSGEEEFKGKVRELRNILANFDRRKNGRRASPGLTNISQKLPLKRSVIETMFELSRRIFFPKKNPLTAFASLVEIAKWSVQFREKFVQP